MQAGTAMKNLTAIVTAGGALAFALSAQANDSTAELATGGLVLTKTDAIEMRAEDLYISAKAVQVRYRFANISPRDVTVTVAFPMPDITTHGFDDLISVPTQDPVNFLGFSTLVDGKRVAAQVEQKVFRRGVDRTTYLKSLGVPLAPQLSSTDDALTRLPPKTRDELVRLGLAVVDEYDVGQGMQKHWEATWTLKTTYYWRQTFPAGREILVEHSYQPSVGESAGTRWGSPDFAKDPSYPRERARYCVDDAFLAAVGRAKAPADQFAPLFEQRIDYVLTTGANWKAPIGEFHMVIDKGDAANLVSFCGDGVRKTSPTEFEVRHTNFTPKSDVAVLILLPQPKQ
jgi:hypothetical protein